MATPTILSDEWFAAVQTALDAAGPVPNGPLVLDQHLTDDDGSWHGGYRVTLDETPAISRLSTDATDESADAAFRQSLTSATRIASGEADAHQAFLLGDIDFTGDVAVLIEHRAALDWLAQVMASV